MSGPIQSSDYVPGVSGWRFNTATGEFEIHGSSAAPESQPITVTAGEWSGSELPRKALEYQKFVFDEMAKIPVNYWDSAEFSTQDFSFDCDASDIRITLTYVRPETPEEVKLRVEKTSVFVRPDRLSGANVNIFCDGKLRLRLGSVEEPSPFIVADGKVYMHQAVVEGSCVSSLWPAAWGVRMMLNADGKLVAAGIGVGIDAASNGESRPDIIVKASHMEILPDGLVKITQAPKKA